MSKDQIIDNFSKYVQKYKVQLYTAAGLDIVMSKRQGIYFWDLEGQRYINCHCNGGVFNLGHSNASVIEAIQKGLRTYDIGNHLLVSQPRTRLAQKLIESLGASFDGEKIDKAVFGVSGGEAVDLAIKIARGYTKKQKILSIEGGYHGHTGFSVGTGDDDYKTPFNLAMPNYHKIKFDELNHIEEYIGDNTAAFILETVPASLGMSVISQPTMTHIRKVCTDKEVLFILDEVQTGLGRTGKCWAFQHYNISPDIVITGKGLAGSIYPISATMFKSKYEVIFKKNPFAHVSTFGGSEIGCIAAMKVLDIVTEPLFQRHVKELSNFFKEEMEN